VTALPDVMEELPERPMSEDRQALEEKSVEALTLWCAHQEDVAGQTSYRVVLDTCEQWGDILPGLQQYRELKA
jgi:hypothetical protein